MSRGRSGWLRRFRKTDSVERICLDLMWRYGAGTRCVEGIDDGSMVPNPIVVVVWRFQRLGHRVLQHANTQGYLQARRTQRVIN